MSALICGSVAYDNIMVFEDSFKNHILPDQIDILNVSFLVPELRRNFGGCALNIAFNLRLLGEDPIPMGTAGCDFDVYAAWLEKHGIRQDCISVLDDVFTAQAYITTDIDDNQIIMFHPGAMNFSHLNKVSNLSGVSIGMISPDGRTGMLEHASQFFEEKIPFIFDPGQGLPMFAGDELRQFIDLSTFVIEILFKLNYIIHVKLYRHQLVLRLQMVIIVIMLVCLGKKLMEHSNIHYIEMVFLLHT